MIPQKAVLSIYDKSVAKKRSSLSEIVFWGFRHIFPSHGDPRNLWPNTRIRLLASHSLIIQTTLAPVVSCKVKRWLFFLKHKNRIVIFYAFCLEQEISPKANSCTPVTGKKDRRQTPLLSRKYFLNTITHVFGVRMHAHILS